MKLFILFQGKNATGNGSNILIGNVPDQDYKVSKIIKGVEIDKQTYDVEVTEWTKELVKGKISNVKTK